MNVDPMIVSGLLVLAWTLLPGAVAATVWHHRRAIRRKFWIVYRDMIHIPPATLSVVVCACFGGCLGWLAMVTLSSFGFDSVILDFTILTLSILGGALLGDKLVDPLIIRLGEKQPLVLIRVLHPPGEKPVPVFQVSAEDGQRIADAVRSQPPDRCKSCGSNRLAIRLVSIGKSKWKRRLSLLFFFRLHTAKVCKDCGAGWIFFGRQEWDRTWIPVPRPRSSEPEVSRSLRSR